MTGRILVIDDNPTNLRLSTPELDVRYRATAQSHFCTKPYASA